MDHQTCGGHWEEQIKPYERQPIRLWIEDISGEQKTEPRNCRLEKVAQEEPGWLKFYINTHQFLSVPVFGEPDTRLETEEERGDDGRTQAVVSFVSEDKASKLIYRVTFE